MLPDPVRLKVWLILFPGDQFDFFSFSTDVLAFLALPVALVSSAQDPKLSHTSQDSVSMAAAQNNPPSLTKMNWDHEGSTSGEWTYEGGAEPTNVTPRTAVLPPSAWLHTAHVSSRVQEDRLGHDTNTVTANTEGWTDQLHQSSSVGVNPGHVETVVRLPAAIPHQTSSSSSSTVDPRMNIQSSAIQDLSQQLGDRARGLRLREHARGVHQKVAPSHHHSITQREVHAAEEPPTDELLVTAGSSSTPSLKTPEGSQTPPVSTPVTSTEPSLTSLNSTVVPDNHTAANETTAEGDRGQVILANATDSPSLGRWMVNVTTQSGLSSNGSTVEVSTKRNMTEAPYTASKNFSNRQVPPTTQDPWTYNNSSDPTINSPPARVMICLSRMEIVWIVLAISVFVSSCCK